ncbi:MAG: hypothetical protein HY807_10775 [Nitrospirae bacterium]|nr:hypothetical protein [Nitrospirota bacterium]
MNTGFLKVIKLSAFAFVTLLIFTSNAAATGHYPHVQLSITPNLLWLIGSNFQIAGADAQVGDEIAVFDSGDNLIGAFTVTIVGEYGTLIVDGNIPATAGTDEGAEAGEALTIKVWDESAQREYLPNEIVLTPGPETFGFLPAVLPLEYSDLAQYSLDVAAGSAAATDTGGSGGGGCFIATAAYGSYLDKNVMVLRKFRDNFLLTNKAGRAFVKFYYKYSPPVAGFIQEHNAVRLTTRAVLTPLVYGIKYPVPAFALFGAAALSGVFIMRRRK